MVGVFKLLMLGVGLGSWFCVGAQIAIDAMECGVLNLACAYMFFSEELGISLTLLNIYRLYQERGVY